MIRGRIALLLCLLLLSLVAAAQSVVPARYFFPRQGFWIADSPSTPQERNSYSIQVGPDGFVFVAIYTYDTTGAPTFLTMQGQLQPASMEERRLGLRSRVESPLYETRGGTPLGTSLPANPQTTISRFGTAYLRFFIAGKGELQFGGKTYPIKPFEAFVNPADHTPENIATGVWSYAVVSNFHTTLQTVSLSRQPTQYPLEGVGYSGLPPGDVQYRLTCIVCTQLTSNGEVDVQQTQAARNSLDRALLSYDRRSDQWRWHTIMNGQYYHMRSAQVTHDEITILLQDVDGFVFLNRLPEALRYPRLY